MNVYWHRVNFFKKLQLSHSFSNTCLHAYTHTYGKCNQSLKMFLSYRFKGILKYSFCFSALANSSIIYCLLRLKKEVIFKSWIVSPLVDFVNWTRISISTMQVFILQQKSGLLLQLRYSRSSLWITCIGEGLSEEGTTGHWKHCFRLQQCNADFI